MEWLIGVALLGALIWIIFAAYRAGYDEGLKIMNPPHRMFTVASAVSFLKQAAVQEGVSVRELIDKYFSRGPYD